MHVALSRHYHGIPKKYVKNKHQSPWQFKSCSNLGSKDSNNWYNAYVSGSCILNNKSLSKIHAKTHHKNGTPLNATKMPSPDDVVSGLTLGFWASLIDKCPNVAWDLILDKVFPKHRVSNSNQWNSPIELKRLSYRLDLIRDFRNRVAHHEPVWKFGDLLSESPPVSGGVLNTGAQRKVIDGSPTNASQSIRRLRNLYTKHLELLKWMSKDIHDDWKLSSNHSHILWLCSDDGLAAHINRKDVMPESMTSSRLKRDISSIVRRKNTAYLHRAGRNLAALHPIR